MKCVLVSYFRSLLYTFMNVIHIISLYSQSDNKTDPSLVDMQNTVNDIENENVPHFNFHSWVLLFPDDEYVM